MSDDGMVRLRPVEERDLVVLERMDTDPVLSEPFEWRGFRDPRARRRRWEKDGYLGTDDSLLVVAMPDGTMAGIVVWTWIPTSGPRGCVQIGILLLPDFRGKGLGTAAEGLLTDYLFATTLANRVEAGTEIGNVAEQRALEKAGFVREGVLRGRGFVRGQWRDGVVYSRLRDDPPPNAQTE